MKRVGIAFLDRPAAREQLRLVQRAEALGYESAWVTETRLARDAVSILGAFAAVTERITLAPGIVNTWTRGPALMAVTFATLHSLAPGRIALGLGAYWDPLAAKQGIRRRKPLTQMREYIDVVRRLLALEESVTFEGQVVRVTDLRLDLGHGEPRDPIDIPIYIGATGPKMNELAGEIADGALINGLLSPDYVRECLSNVALGAATAGRSLDQISKPGFVNVAMSPDGASARHAAHRLVTMYLGQQPHIAKASGLPEDFLEDLNRVLGGWPPAPGGIERAMKKVPAEVVAKLTVAGTPDECREQLQAWSEAGIDYPVIVPVTENYDQMLEAFAPEAAQTSR